MSLKTETRVNEKVQIKEEISSEIEPVANVVSVRDNNVVELSLPKLSVGSSFSLFLADYKAANSK